MKKLTGIIIGVLLICCGALYALEIFGVTDINLSFDGWWTMFIILPCLYGLITSKDKLGNLLGLSFGVLLLLAARDVFDYDIVWKAIIPAIIVVIGIKLIVKSAVSPSADGKENLSGGDGGELMAVFTSQKQDYSGMDFSAAKVGAVFGGAEYNLSNAKIADGSKLDVMCVFGGVDIFLPKNVIVKNNSFCLFGGISDKRETVKTDETAVTVYINGFCMFGGVDIK